MVLWTQFSKGIIISTWVDIETVYDLIYYDMKYYVSAECRHLYTVYTYRYTAIYEIGSIENASPTTMKLFFIKKKKSFNSFLKHLTS